MIVARTRSVYFNGPTYTHNTTPTHKTEYIIIYSTILKPNGEFTLSPVSKVVSEDYYVGVFVNNSLTASRTFKQCKGDSAECFTQALLPWSPPTRIKIGVASNTIRTTLVPVFNVHRKRLDNKKHNEIENNKCSCPMDMLIGRGCQCGGM